jgi:hypothetical protein
MTWAGRSGALGTVGSVTDLLWPDYLPDIVMNAIPCTDALPTDDFRAPDMTSAIVLIITRFYLE